MVDLDKYFPLKPGSTPPPPNIYLGSKVSKVVLPNGVEYYAFSSIQYVKEAANNIEGHMDKQVIRRCIRVSTSLSPSYRPELGATPELRPSDSS